MVNNAMFTINKYHNTYFQIINKAKDRQLPKLVRTEIHHIIPRSLGGTDLPDNLVKLTLKEHWVCHRLLVKFLDDPVALRKMYNALYMMAVKDYRTINGRIYQSIKENIVPWNKGLKGIPGNPISNEGKQKLSALYKNKKRPVEHTIAMKEGWKKAKENGYQPWNKGLTGLSSGPKQKVILISPDGEEYKYESLREGCKAQSLIYTKMSSVNSGKQKHYKGWTVKKVSIA